jgi:hypothetical protein
MQEQVKDDFKAVSVQLQNDFWATAVAVQVLSFCPWVMWASLTSLCAPSLLVGVAEAFLGCRAQLGRHGR